MSEIYKVAVIGGGFSGLVAAERLSEKYRSAVVVIEKCDRVGKKILATGNGRGNISNEKVGEKYYHSVGGASVGYAVGKYGYKSIKAYFSSLGMTFIQEDGKLYPSSMQASSVLDLMRMKIRSNGGKEIVNSKCNDIKFKDGIFEIITESGVIFAENAILSCGGKSQKQYGTDGSSYALAEKFGHKTTKLFPSLVQLKTSTDKIRGLKGIKQIARVKAFCGGEELSESVGDVLFTEYGVSGNTVFTLSAYVAGRENCSISIEFLPDMSENQLIDVLIAKSRLGYVQSEDALTGIINKQIGKVVVKNLGITTFDKDAAVKIAKEVKNFKLPIIGTLGFDYSQVTRGGIEFSGVDEVTFESKYRKNLYIIGEMLDVDGDCGGYNLHFAYASARCCSEAIISEDRKR